jgi:hypothetical protein
MLSHYINKNQDNWDEHLPYLLFAYRTSIQEFTKRTPFECVFGRLAQFPTDITLRTIADNYINQGSPPFLLQLKENIGAVSAVINAQFDELELRRSNDSDEPQPRFVPGDLVLHYVPRVPRGKMKKLSYLWQGPYMVLEVFSNGINYKVHRVNSNNLKLNNHAASKIVNAHSLKKYYPHSSSLVRGQ